MSVKRNRLLFAGFLLIFTLSLFLVPTSNSPIKVNLQSVPNYLEYSGIGDDTEDFVDQVSDLWSPSDKGTHDVFADLQDYGSNFDAMAEANQGAAGNDVEDFVDQQSTEHAPDDIGTHAGGGFAEMQDYDSTYDVLTEADTGGSGGSQEWYGTAASDPLAQFTNDDNTWDADTASYATSTSAVTADAYPAISVSGYDSLSAGSGTISQVDIIVRMSVSGTGNDEWGITLDVGGSTGNELYAMTTSEYSLANNTFSDVSEPNDASWSWTDIRATSIHFDTEKVQGSDGRTINIYEVLLIVTTAAASNYDLDLEVGWTSADYDETSGEELCIFGGTQGSEALRVDVWNGAWTNVIEDLAAGWNNVSVSSYLTDATFEIRFTDTSDDAVEADTWEVEGVLLHCWTTGTTDYELDLEIGWTSADYDETSGEELCIYPVTGGGWPSEAIAVDVYSGGWQQVFADLTPDQWNNVSVSSYLTDATFEIRFRDGDQADDGTPDTWEIDAVLLHTWTTSYTPANDIEPTLDNPTDSNRMYAKYTEYQITMYCSDANGFADIDYMELSYWDDSQTTEYWRLRYDEDTNTFSEEYDIGTVISLNTGSSSATESGDDIDATFYVTIDWTHVDISDGDAKCYVIDTQSEEATNWYEVTWRVETRLDYTVSPYVSADDAGTVDHGDLDETFYVDGTLIYYESTDDNPPSDQVDVWASMSEYGTSAGPWSDTTLTAGAFQITCYGDDATGTDTITVKPVAESAGSGGTSLYYTTDLTDTYTSDQIQVQSYSSDDPRIDISTEASDHVTLYYATSGNVVDGTITVNGVSCAYSGGSGIWDFGETKTSVQSVTYNTIACSGDDTHGITSIDQNGQSLEQIWDRIIVKGYMSSDDRDNVDDNVDIEVWLQYEYDSANVTDGTVTINGASASYLYGGNWSLTDSESTVVLNTYDTVAASGNTHGITVINQDSKSINVIWDRLNVDIQADDETPGNEVEVTFTLTITYEYDSASCTTYKVKIHRNATHWYTFINANTSLFVDTNSDTVYLYNASLIVEETEYDITAFTTNTETVTWGSANVAPENDTDAVLQNADDSTYLYAKYRFYTITSNVSDSNGYADISMVLLLLFDNTQTNNYWTLKYIQSTNAFSVFNGSGYLSIADWSSYVKDGNTLEIVWQIKIDWDHPELNDIDIKQFVNDSQDESASNFYECNWDFETRLDITSITLTDGSGTLDHGPLDGSYTVSGTIIYYGSGNDNPFDNETDVWISITEYGSTVGPFSDLTYSAGEFEVTCYADNEAGLDTLTIKVVIESAGSGGTTLLHENDQDTYISDRVKVSSYSVSDDHVNINDNVNIDVTLIYEYDSSEVTDGTVTINGASAAHQGSGVWRITDSEASVMANTYDTVAYSGGTHGLTQVNQDSKSTTVVWDQVIVNVYLVTDPRTDISTSVTVYVELEYDYDNSDLDDGTVIVNSIPFSYVSNGNWSADRQQSSVTSETFNSVVVSGNTEGITSVNQNGQSITIIWDRTIVRGYMTNSTDNRDNINDPILIEVWLQYEYDSTNVTDGTVTINGASASYLYGGNWSIEDSESTVVANTYNAIAASGNTHGITVVNQDSKSVTMIWDKAVVQTTVSSSSDGRDNINDNIEVRVTIWLEYDDSYLGSGDSVTLDDQAMTWDSGNSWWDLTVSQSTVDDWFYFVNSTSETSYGITELDLNSKSVKLIWDRVKVSGYSVSDPRDNVGDDVNIDVTLIYEYDSSEVTDGTVTINGASAAHQGSGVWRITDSEASVTSNTYNTVAASGNEYSISTVDQNGQSTSVIWDRAIVRGYMTNSTDDRDNINDGVSIEVWLQYEYDSANVTDGTVTINSISASYISGGNWSIEDSEASVISNTYNTVTTSGNTHGITVVNQDSKSTAVVWDRVEVVISSLTSDYTYQDISEAINLTITLRYDYDDELIVAGSFAINTESLSHIGSGVWEADITKVVGSSATYNDLTTCSATKYDITEYTMNSESLTLYWDRVEAFSSGSASPRTNINSYGYSQWDIRLENALITITSGVSGTTTRSLALSYSSGHWRTSELVASVEAREYGIETLSLDGISQWVQSASNVTIIWDRAKVYDHDAIPLSLQVRSYSHVRLWLVYEYDNTSITDGSVTLYGITTVRSMEYSATNGYWFVNLTETTPDIYNYYVNSVSGNTHGISALNLNSKDVDIEFLASTAGTTTQEGNNRPTRVVTIDFWVTGLGVFGFLCIIGLGIVFSNMYELPGVERVNKSLKTFYSFLLPLRKMFGSMWSYVASGLSGLFMTLKRWVGYGKTSTRKVKRSGLSFTQKLSLYLTRFEKAMKPYGRRFQSSAKSVLKSIWKLLSSIGSRIAKRFKKLF